MSIDGLDQSSIINSKKTEELLAYLICGQNTFLRKSAIAEALWEGLAPDRAMDNFYKIYKHLSALPSLGIPLHLKSQRGKLCLLLDNIESDILLFERLYTATQTHFDPALCKQAIGLYHGPLFCEECYAWSTLWESYYDLHYTEMLEQLIKYLATTTKKKELAYYRRKYDDIMEL